MILSETPKIELLNMDCMQLMADTPDKYYDLAIVDPPYGISEPAFRKKSKNKAAKLTNYHKAVWKQDIPTNEYFIELDRVSKNQIIWGGNYFGLRGSRCWVVWDKETQDTQWADAELAWTSFPISVKLFRFAWNGMIQGDMKNKQIRIHPTEKPIQLYKWLLTNFAKQGDKILDTHAGSFSIGIACKEMGYDITATELDVDYYEASIKRYNLVTSQLKLF